MTPYYEEGGITIYHGRCEVIIPTLGPIDLVFTSPPYNIGRTGDDHFGHYRDGQGRGGHDKWDGATAGGIGYDNHDDAMDPDHYERWQQRILAMLWRQLTDDGAIFYNHRPTVRASTLWLPTVLNPGLPIRQIVIWDRRSGMNYTPTAFVPSHEWIILFAKPNWRLKSKGVSGLLDVWSEPPESGSDHPSPFPIGLPARAIEATRDGVVLDPFMGSGTTLRAAKNIGRRAIGIDKSEQYCEMAAKRLGQEVLAL